MVVVVVAVVINQHAGIQQQQLTSEREREKEQRRLLLPSHHRAHDHHRHHHHRTCACGKHKQEQQTHTHIYKQTSREQFWADKLRRQVRELLPLLLLLLMLQFEACSVISATITLHLTTAAAITLSPATLLLDKSISTELKGDSNCAHSTAPSHSCKVDTVHD